MSFDNMVEVDIESKKIERGAPLLPLPVGVALGIPGRDRIYLAWGHPSGNNCTKEDAGRVIQSIWDRPWLTHNGAIFDVPDLAHHFGLAPRNPLLTHDTLFAAYLSNPHARSLSLKDLAENELGIAPDEQQEMYDWIMANVPDCRSRKECGAYISETPAEISGPYAIGDIHRTREIWEHFKPAVLAMPEAYDRERKLAPIIAKLQHRGVRVDMGGLHAVHAHCRLKKAKVEALIRDHIKVGTEFDFKDAVLCARLKELGYSGFLMTPTGKPSMNKESLEKVLAEDPVLRTMLKSRSTYDTLLTTFIVPWLEMATANNGRMHPNYNQVRNPDGFGTRTGRLSSNDPNFQNVPSDRAGDDWEGDPFPLMRSFLLPEEGQVWVCGDFKSQEPRLTAHYEGGALLEAFIANPHLDPYQFIMQLAGGSTTRHQAKQIFLGLVYAMGVDRLAEKLGCSSGEASVTRNIVKASIPDVVALDRECKKRFQSGLPIRTLGGRIYYCEPPSNGRSWEYKALNTLIQGSAADQSKEGMIYVDPLLDAIGGRLLGQVHDELSASCFERDYDSVCEMFQEAANYLPCDVPMIMDVGYGPNWAEAKP